MLISIKSVGASRLLLCECVEQLGLIKLRPALLVSTPGMCGVDYAQERALALDRVALASLHIRSPRPGQIVRRPRAGLRHPGVAKKPPNVGDRP